MAPCLLEVQPSSLFPLPLVVTRASCIGKQARRRREPTCTAVDGATSCDPTRRGTATSAKFAWTTSTTTVLVRALSRCKNSLLHARHKALSACSHHHHHHHNNPSFLFRRATTEQGPESALGSAPSVSSTYFCKPSASTFSSWAARPYIGCLPRGDPFIAVAVRSTEQRGQSHVSVGQSAFGSVSIAPPGVLCFECLVCHFFNKELEQLN